MRIRRPIRKVQRFGRRGNNHDNITTICKLLIVAVHANIRKATGSQNISNVTHRDTRAELMPLVRPGLCQIWHAFRGYLRRTSVGTCENGQLTLLNSLPLDDTSTFTFAPTPSPFFASEFDESLTVAWIVGAFVD